MHCAYDSSKKTSQSNFAAHSAEKRDADAWIDNPSCFTRCNWLRVASIVSSFDSWYWNTPSVPRAFEWTIVFYLARWWTHTPQFPCPILISISRLTRRTGALYRTIGNGQIRLGFGSTLQALQRICQQSGRASIVGNGFGTWSYTFSFPRMPLLDVSARRCRIWCWRRSRG